MAQYKHLEIPGNFERYVKDKRQSANAYYRYFLSRLTSMFEYKRLPDTIPHQIFDRYLFNNGINLITKVRDKLYCFYGNAGGPQDAYYRPCQFIVANPHIIGEDGEPFSANITIFENDRYPELGQPTGVLMRNDSEWMGLAPMLARYSFLMAENILTLRTADVMLRITSLLTAPSDKERTAALEYLKTIENGGLGVIGDSPFFDGVKMQSPPSNNGSYLTQFIEYQQYLKGSLYNELGLSANYNMKREAIGKGESTLDEDALLPLCDNMLLCRKEDLKKVNEMFGTDIEVSFSSAWLQNRIESRSTLVTMVGQPTGGVPFGASNPSNPSNPAQVGQPTDEKDEGGNGQFAAEGEDGSSTAVPGHAPGEHGAEGAIEPDAKDVPKDEPEEEHEGEHEDSKINDESWSEDLHELEDKIEEKMDEPVGQPMMEGGENNDDGGMVGESDEKTEDDERDNPAD